MEQRAAQTEVMLGPLQGHPQPHSEASGLGPPQLMALKQFRRSQGGRGSCSRPDEQNEAQSCPKHAATWRQDLNSDLLTRNLVPLLFLQELFNHFTGAQH